MSIGGGIYNSVTNAKSLGCTAFQLFTRNPRGWHAKDLTSPDIEQFKSNLSASGISRDAVVVHMPYLPNLSAPAGEIYDKSVFALSQEAERSHRLGIPSIVIHLGSHLGTGKKEGQKQLVSALRSVAESASLTNTDLVFLLENSAGQKNTTGSSFEELRVLLDALDDPKRFGICFDTCHAFAAGYDLRTEGMVEKVLENFDSTVGLGVIRTIHMNDSKGGLGSKLDRHENIGIGNIGLEGLGAFLKHRICKEAPVILETPKETDADDRRNLSTVTKLASR